MKIVNYEDILSTLKQKRISHLHIEDARKAEIYAAIPRIHEIDDAIASNSLQAAKDRILKRPVNKEQVRQNTQALIAEKKQLLKSYGYPEDYLQPVYDCKLCQDTGYVDNQPCHCLKQLVINELYEQSTIRTLLEKENFDTFSLDYYSDESDGVHPHTPYHNAKNILEKSRQFVYHFDRERRGILIYGETGLGKTFLSNCIAKALLDSGHTVLYLSSIHLFENILSDIIMNHAEDDGKRMLYDYIYSCELLIIDDLGTELTNSFVQSQLFEIINTRNNKSLSTLISTNLTIRQLQDRYTERTMSRIVADYIVFNLYGDNIRYTKRKQRISKNIHNS